MTSRIVIKAPDGSLVEARALLDSASSASFVSERIAQSLRLPRMRQSARISGIARLTRNAARHYTHYIIHSPTIQMDQRYFCHHPSRHV